MSGLVRRLRRGSRNYVAAAMLNLALLNTVLTPNTRPAVAQTRSIATTPRFRETELVRLENGSVGVLCIGYAAGGRGNGIRDN